MSSLLDQKSSQMFASPIIFLAYIEQKLTQEILDRGTTTLDKKNLWQLNQIPKS